jgi:hypothetical protein
MNKKELYHEVGTLSLVMGVAIVIFIFGLFIRFHVMYTWLIRYYGGKWECLKKHLH